MMIFKVGDIVRFKDEGNDVALDVSKQQTIMKVIEVENEYNVLVMKLTNRKEDSPLNYNQPDMFYVSESYIKLDIQERRKNIIKELV